MADGWGKLTARQLEIVSLLCEGLSNKQIARRLQISHGTVKVHVANIFRTLGVSTRLQAVVAVQNINLQRTTRS
jgi:DNA-binding NarL/FixJ family response regulator